MVLNYWGIAASEADLAAQLGATPLGTPGSRLLRLQTSQLQVTYEPITLMQLQETLRQGVPVITLAQTIFLDYWEIDTAHAVVVIGLAEDSLFINDPAFENAPQKATIDGFLAAWGEFDNLAGIIKRLND
jgi:ABC-type bacteriocin/lantibiotic exporter with double-glycine peptidase domain